MSNRRRPSVAPLLPARVGVQFAVAFDEASIPEARRLSHDALINLMGSRRASGVRWAHYGQAEGLRVVTIAAAEDRLGATPETVAAQAELVDAIRSSPGCTVVMAMADEVPA